MRRVVLILCLCVMGVAAQADLVSAPYIAGEFQDPTWQPGETPMNDIGGGIWEYTITGLTPGVFHGFKVTDGTWNVTAPAANSWYIAPASGEVTVTFNTNVVLDGWLPEQFRVGVSTDPGSWSLVGNYNGWINNDPTQLMTSLGGGIYMLSQTLPAGDWEIKPVNTGTWDGIGLDGRSSDAQNMPLSLVSDTVVTIYVDAFAGTFGTKEDIYGARFPDPANNAILPFDVVTDLSWTNPDNPDESSADPLGVEVRFEKEPTGIYDPNWTSGVYTVLADDSETVSLSTLTTLPLDDNSLYSWQVKVIDSNSTGGDIEFESRVWLFEVGDSPAVPGQPVDQYMWLSQDDSALETEFGPGTAYNGPVGPNIRYFEVTASYTDDGKSPIVDANFVNLNWDYANGELGVLEVSDDHTAATKSVRAVYRTVYEEGGDPSETTAIPGLWNIQLEVTDNTGTAQGASGYHRIVTTCKEAAAEDPSDDFDGTYDVNSDCKNDIVDFAAFAAVWLDEGVKYE